MRRSCERSRVVPPLFGYLNFRGVPLVGAYDRTHLQAIHKHIVQDVYEWAGKLRTVEIAKPGSPFFAFQRYVIPSLDTLTAQLKAEDHFRGLVADDFAIRAGHYLGEVNAIHPFREGNGRTQQEFVRALALEAGHRIAWAKVSREQMYAASKISFERADSSGLAAVIDIAINSPDSERAAVRAALAVERDRSTIATDAAAVLAARFRVDLSTATALGGERFSRLEDTIRDHDQASHHRGDDLFGPLTIGS